MHINEFEKDIGKFVTLSYKAADGTPKFAQGRLDSINEGFLIIVNNKNPEKIRRVNPEEVTISDYSSEPLEVRQ